MRNRKSQTERRAQILDAASKMFAQHGYENVQIRDLMRETELSRGGFYHHFSRKGDVLRGLVESEVAALVNHAENDLTSLIQLGSIHAGGDPGVLDTIKEPKDLAEYLGFLEIAHENQIGPMIVRAIETGVSAGCFQPVVPGHIAEIFLAVNARSNRKTLTGKWNELEAVEFAKSALSIFAAALGAPDLFADLELHSPSKQEHSQ